LRKFLEEEGIVVQHTMLDILQQNCVVEIRNCMLTDMVMSIISTSNLPLSLWSEALKIVMYILNRVPYKAVPKISFKLWNEYKSSLTHLHI
jgi:hypothetical protein